MVCVSAVVPVNDLVLTGHAGFVSPQSPFNQEGRKREGETERERLPHSIRR